MYKRRKHKRRILIAKLVLVLSIVVCLMLLVDNSLRPLIITHAAAQSQNMVDSIINNEVYNYLDTCEYTYTDISHVERGASNEIESVEIDSVKINSMAAKIMKRVNDSFDRNDSMIIRIPIGTMTGNDFLIGRGPKISIKMDLSANISADFSTKFTEAGINQTLHSINFIITAKIYLMNKFYQSSFKTENTYILAQTIIVGEIPSVVAELTESTLNSAIKK